MPSMFRATFFFQQGLYGWSETHWSLTATDINDCLAKAQNLAYARVLLLGNGVLLSYIRASDDSVYRDALVIPGVPYAFALSQSYSKQQDVIPVLTEVPYSVVLLRAESGALYRKQIYLSGVPQAIITSPVGPIFTPGFQKPFDSWVKQLTNGGWGFKVLSKVLNDIGPFPITQISAANPPILTVNNHGLKNGDAVKVSGVKLLSGKMNGVWYVQPIDANTFTLKNFTGVPIWLGGGQITKRIYLLVPYSNVEPIRETHRKRGSPFGRPRGRSPRRR